MKSNKHNLVILQLKFITLLIFFCFTTNISAANLYLTDFSGQTGPAPAPAPYATTYLFLDNAPNDIANFKIKINYDPSILAAWCININDGLLSEWDYTQTSHISGSSGSYYLVEGWTLGPSVKAGYSGLIAEITFEVKENINSTVWLNGLERDIQTWSYSDAKFSYILIPEAYPPVANAGPDQVVFNLITLDASGSSDVDNNIISWEWTLIHRSNSSYSTSASGQVAIIANIAPGFYDVVLTVTDDTGLIDTDSMLLAVSELPIYGDANQNGKIGLEDIIILLQILTGIR